jgi:hypothetical protein
MRCELAGGLKTIERNWDFAARGRSLRNGSGAAPT